MDNSQTLRALIFQRVRFLDTELAEDLYRRMPEVASVSELNGFMHQLLAQYEENTFHLRTNLQDTDFVTWNAFFQTSVLPFLIQHRLPPMTNANTTPTYAGLSYDLTVKG
jgi:hypothetical protein